MGVLRSFDSLILATALALCLLTACKAKSAEDGYTFNDAVLGELSATNAATPTFEEVLIDLRGAWIRGSQN